MGLFGKILLVLNLLLSGGFVYFVVQDWKGRQTITAAGLRHKMLLEGVPLQGGPDTLPARVTAGSDGYSDFTSEKIPFVIEGPGNVRTTTVSPELLYAYFNAAGGADASSPLAGNTPVASQMAEVKRVFNVLKGQQNVQERNAFVAEALLRLAENFEERSEYVEWQAKGNAAELLHAMDLKFHRVLPELVTAGPLESDKWVNREAPIKELEAQRDAAVKASADAEAAGNASEAEKKKAEAGALISRIERRRDRPPQDEVDRKFRLAQLLVHLDTAAGWQKRVAMIVGLKAYVKAVDAQSGKFKEIFDRVEQATIVDQERFLGEYTMLRSMAIERTQLVLKMAEIRAQLTAQAQKDQDLVNQRELQEKDLIAQLTAIRAVNDDLRAKQTLVEQQLLLVEREIGLKLEDIYRLEAELKKVEKERYEQKK